MESFLNGLYASTNVPFFSALILGLLTAISPCPLATNISAIGYIGRDLSSKKRVFLNGLYYTLGRTLAYTSLAIILAVSANQFQISAFFQQYGEKIIGPLMLVAGVFMLGLFSINFPVLSKISERFSSRLSFSYWNAFLLGVVFALAFCPYSGVLYFGMLVPLTISTSGYHLPIVFAVATGIPVIIFAWLIAYTISGVGKTYKRLKVFEFWFRKIVAVLFIGTGIYYILVIWIK